MPQLVDVPHQPHTPLLHARVEDEFEYSLPADVSTVPSAARKLGAFAVGVLLFASVAGGPYGIEAAVGSAGAGPVIFGSIVLAIMWSATQALVAAELSCAYPSNGGFITWGVKGLGPTLGFVNAANSIVSAVCNLPLYPVLFVSYIQQLFPGVSTGALWAIKLVALLLTASLNSFGIEAVSTVSTVFSVIVQTPFILMPIAAAAYKAPTFTWSAVTSTVPGWESNISVFISTLCWNAQGWVNVGNLASEVRNPKVSYPLGAGMAVVFVALNYIYPVALCAALAPNVGEWDTGYFVTIGKSISPWVGYWVAVGAAFSCMNNFQPQLGTNARALRFAALYRMLPIRFLDRNWEKYRTPVPAILLQSIFIAVLMSFGFNVLVVINVLFYNIGLMFQFAAFLRLRYTAPHMPRPYKVPGGMLGAWAVVLLFYTLLGVAYYSAAANSWWSIAVAGGANVIFLVVGKFWWARYHYHDTLIDCIDAAEATGSDASKAAGNILELKRTLSRTASGLTVSSMDSSATNTRDADRGDDTPMLLAPIIEEGHANLELPWSHLVSINNSDELESQAHA